MRNAMVALATSAVAAAIPDWAMAQAFDPDRYGYGQHMWGGGGWAGLFLGPLFMILVLALVIALAVLIVRWLGGASQGMPPPPPGRAPLDILKERFARGEIDEAEYESRRRVLGE